MVSGHGRRTIINAVIDIGNTAVKIAELSKDEHIQNVKTIQLSNWERDHTHIIQPGPGVIILASSGSDQLQKRTSEILEATGKTVLTLRNDGDLPFRSSYAPGEAGIDRLANVAAAIRQTGGKPAVVVDAGSAITLEVVGPSGQFDGGAILCGMGMQAAALHNQTACLPHITPGEEETPAIGLNTAEAIQTGIINGTVGGIERLLRITLDQLGMADAQILITGGDGALFAQLLHQPRISYIPDLTIRGLYLLANAQYPKHFPPT